MKRSELCLELREVDDKVIFAMEKVRYIESYTKFTEKSGHEYLWRNMIPIFNYDGEPLDKAYQLLPQEKVDKIKQILERYNGR